MKKLTLKMLQKLYFDSSIEFIQNLIFSRKFISNRHVERNVVQSRHLSLLRSLGYARDDS